MVAPQVQPLTEALLGFDDAARKLDELERLARPAKTEIKAFLARLRQADETEAFEARTYKLAETSGRSTLAAEIRELGGPVALLEKADTLFDELIAERRRATAGGLDALLETLGLTVSLSAGIRTTACGAVFFVMTLGYGTNLAHRACYY